MRVGFACPAAPKPIKRHGRRGECIGVSFGTNGAKYAVDEVPVVVFGPGSIDQAHTADEWISIDELQTASDVIVDFAQALK